MNTLILLSSTGAWLLGLANAQGTSSTTSTSATPAWTGFGPPPGWTPPAGFRSPWLSNLPTAATKTETVVAATPTTDPTASTGSAGSTLSTAIRPESSQAIGESTSVPSNATVVATGSNNTTSAVGIGVGVSVGVAVIVLGVLLFAFWYFKRRKTYRMTEKDEQDQDSSGTKGISPATSHSEYIYGGHTLTSAGGYTSPQASSPTEMATSVNMQELSPAAAVVNYELNGRSVVRHEMSADEGKMKDDYYSSANRGTYIVELPGDHPYRDRL